MFPGTYEHLRLHALDPYDLALAKLSRNIERDRDDGESVYAIAKTLNEEGTRTRYGKAFKTRTAQNILKRV